VAGLHPQAPALRIGHLPGPPAAYAASHQQESGLLSRLLDVGEDVWISFVIRDNQLVPVGGATSLRAGDEILALTDPERGPDLGPIFSKPGTGPASA
jgi:NhaP-type Na+/H+ and K+/H+ antiporter